MKKKNILQKMAVLTMLLALFLSVAVSPVKAATPTVLAPTSVSQETANWFTNALAQTPDERGFFEPLQTRVTGPTIVGIFKEKNFYSNTPMEAFALQLPADTITVHGVCENGAKDTVICHIRQRGGSGLYDVDIPFTADDSVGTVPWNLPEGKYWIYFTSTDATVCKSVEVFFGQHGTA